MKIIFSVKTIYPFHSYGGVEKYIYNMAKYLANNNIDVEIVSSFYKKGVKNEFYEGIHFTFLPPKISSFTDYSLGRLGEHIFGFSLRGYLSKKDFDLLHGVELTPYVYLHKKDKKPVIFHLFYDTYRKKPYRDKLYYLKYPFIKTLKTDAVKYCLKNSDCVISETPAQTIELEKTFNIDRNKIFDIPVAIDIDTIEKFQKSSKITREKIGLKNDDFVLISVNRLVPEKGIDYLIDSFRIVKNEIKEAKLIIIGSGYQECEIISKIQNYNLKDSVVLMKNIKEEDLYGYYSISDIYVSPTLQEDFIMSIQEAMVCGLPIVSTGQDWLVHNGINGYIVEKRKSEMLADRIVKIYKDKNAKGMGLKSKEIIKEYDWNLVIKRLIKVYEITLQNKY